MNSSSPTGRSNSTRTSKSLSAEKSLRATGAGANPRRLGLPKPALEDAGRYLAAPSVSTNVTVIYEIIVTSALVQPGTVRSSVLPLQNCVPSRSLRKQ
jgi:hypothetical protein